MEIILPHLEPWQQDLMDIYTAHTKDNIITVKSQRQIGKSTAIEILLIWISVYQKGISMCVSPTIAQARKVYKEVADILTGTPLVKKINSSALIITFFNDSIIYFKSSEQQNALRGYTISNVMVVDEACFVPDSVIWELLLPMTNVHHASMILTSTPKFKQGAFYDCYVRGTNGVAGYITIDWTTYDTSKFLPQDKLELYRMQLPKLAFESEYLGEFIDGDSTLFWGVKDCIGDTATIYAQPIMSIDWASGNGKDYTAITLLSQDEHGKIYVNDLRYFNDKSTNETIDYIMRRVKEYHPWKIVVEINSIGKVFFDALRDKVYEYVDEEAQKNIFSEHIDIQVKGVATTNASKDRWVKGLSKRFEDKDIVIPENQNLLNQLSVYECKISPTGLPTYNAPSGYHDDMVMSLMIGVAEMTSGRYS